MTVGTVASVDVVPTLSVLSTIIKIYTINYALVVLRLVIRKVTQDNKFESLIPDNSESSIQISIEVIHVQHEFFYKFSLQDILHFYFLMTSVKITDLLMANMSYLN